jgi:hypothetical protein
LIRRKTLLVLVMLTLIFLLVSSAMALPKMFLPQEEFNFGFVPQDSKVSHVFWIKSVGEDSLIIVSVKPG